MTTRTISYRFKLRNDTAANWAASNPVLLDGEPGLEDDTGREKLGDGVRAWLSLPYQDELLDHDAGIGPGEIAHLASTVAVTPVGGIAATDVQAALAELDAEKVDTTTAQTVAGVKSIEAVRTKRDPVDACHPDFGASPTNIDNTAAIQAAVDSFNNTRGDVIFSIPGTYTLTGSLDRKRTRLRGLGAPGQNGGTGAREGGTVLHFTGTGGVFSSIKDDFGPPLKELELRGSGDGVTDNGQVLLDWSGINYPRMRDVRFWNAGTGLRIQKGAEVGAKESHYGAFFACDFNQCFIGIDWPAETGNGTHSVFGGRFWSCKTGVKIGLGVNNINFFGVAFECGAGNTGVDSTGRNINFWGCRWETPGGNLVVRSGAAAHFCHGDHWSTGTDINDENIPSVVYGTGVAGLDGAGLTAPHTSLNLISNGGFKRDVDSNGRADDWLETFSSSGTQTYAIVADPYNEGSAQQVNSGTANNLRLYQTIQCVPNVPHMLRFRGRVNAGTNNFIRIGSSTNGIEWGQLIMPADNVWRETRLAFTPTASTVFITWYMSGTTSRTLELAGVVVNPGLAAAPGFVSKVVTDSSPIALGRIHEPIATGESNMDRRDVLSAAVTMSSGFVRGGFFTATKTESITKIAAYTGTTAAGATPTVCRFGVWETDLAGNLRALVASTANDTTLFAATQTEYERTLSATFNKVAGKRYFAGVLVVTGATVPTLTGAAQGTGAPVASILHRSPMISGVIAAVADDLPASGAVSGNGLCPYVELRP